MRTWIIIEEVIQLKVDIFAMYIFSRYLCSSNISENVYSAVKIKNVKKREFNSTQNCLFSQTHENVYIYTRMYLCSQ